jgi:hypothetical protein
MQCERHTRSVCGAYGFRVGCVGAVGCLWSDWEVALCLGSPGITDPSTNSAPILFGLSSTWLDSAVTVSVA